LTKPTVAENEMASRAAEIADTRNTRANDNQIVQIPLRQKSKNIDNLSLHYRYEAQLSTYRRDIHQLWNQTFATTPVSNTKIIIGTRDT
jgi:hypothetical protein